MADVVNTSVFSVYDTLSQAETFLVEIPQNNFIQNFLFPYTDRNRFFTKKVVLDFDAADIKEGAYISKGYVNGNTVSYRSTAVDTPRIAVSDTINPAEDHDRLLMEQIAQAMGSDGSEKAAVFENLKRVKCMRLGQRVLRKIENQAVQCLIDNAVRDSYPTSPSDSTPITLNIEFSDPAKGNKRFIPAIAWDQPNATPLKDLEKMVYNLISRGGQAKVIIMAPQAWQCLREDPLFEKFIRYIHTENAVMGNVGQPYDDADRVATAVVMGYKLDIIVYAGGYEDENGVYTQYLPKDFVCVTAQGAGRLLTAGITQLNAGALTANDPQNTSHFIPRSGKLIFSQYMDLNTQELSLRCESLPLCAPKNDCGWIVGLMNNSNVISDGKIAPAIDVDFELKAAEAGVTLPSNVSNIEGGKAFEFTIPTATASGKTVDVSVNGEAKLSGQAQGTKVSVDLPLVDTLIELEYK